MEHLQVGVNKKFVEWHEFSFRTRANRHGWCFPAAFLLHHVLQFARSCTRRMRNIRKHATARDAAHSAESSSLLSRMHTRCGEPNAPPVCRRYLHQISSICQDRLRSCGGLASGSVDSALRSAQATVHRGGAWSETACAPVIGWKFGTPRAR